MGGFHVGLAQEGNECVYASEINTELNEIYQKNFGIKPNEDITKVNPEEIPNHDILCAGFPCQPFSKSAYWVLGDTKRLEDPRADTLTAFLRVLKDIRPYKKY